MKQIFVVVFLVNCIFLILNSQICSGRFLTQPPEPEEMEAVLKQRALERAKDYFGDPEDIEQDEEQAPPSTDFRERHLNRLLAQNPDLLERMRRSKWNEKRESEGQEEDPAGSVEEENQRLIKALAKRLAAPKTDFIPNRDPLPRFSAPDADDAFSQKLQGIRSRMNRIKRDHA